MRAALIALALLSCTDAQPCVSCPPLEGVWFLQYMTPTRSGCSAATLPAPPMTVSLTRQGSVLHGAIDGISIQGTLYDTYDYVLSGIEAQLDGGSRTASLRGRYTKGSTADAGTDTLDGTLSRAIPSCSEDTRYTGARS